MTVPRRIAALLLASVAMSVALASSPAARDLVTQADAAWHAAVVAAEHPLLLTVSHAFALVGAAVVTIPLRAAVTLWLAWRRSWWRLGAWIASIGLSETWVTLMKASYDRPRPPLALEVTRSAAYPSGHAAVTAAVLTALVLIALPADRSRRFWGSLAVALVVAMAWSRTYLRVHWLSDVVVGAAVGATASVVAVVLVAALERRRLTRTPPGPPAAETSRAP